MSQSRKPEEQSSLPRSMVPYFAIAEKRRPAGDVLVFHVPCVINGAMLIYLLTGFRSHVSTVDRAGASSAVFSPASTRARDGWLRGKPRDGVGRWVIISAC